MNTPENGGHSSTARGCRRAIAGRREAGEGLGWLVRPALCVALVAAASTCIAASHGTAPKVLAGATVRGVQLGDEAEPNPPEQEAPDQAAPARDGNQSSAQQASGTARAAVYFSPNGGAQAAIVREIDAARRSVLVQAYSFTSAPVAEAMVRAHRRGVSVRAVLDKSNRTARYSGATFLSNAGVEVRIDAKHPIAHSKIMLIDASTPGATILTGSFNFSKAAEEKNAENLLVLKDCPALVASYVANWEAHAAHSEAYARQ